MVPMLADGSAKDARPAQFGDLPSGRVEPPSQRRILQMPETGSVTPGVAGLSASDRADPQADRFARHLEMPAIVPRNEAAGGGSASNQKSDTPQTPPSERTPDRPNAVLARAPETTDAAMPARRDPAPSPMSLAAAPVVPPADPGGVEPTLAAVIAPGPAGLARGADLDPTVAMTSVKSDKSMTVREPASAQPAPARDSNRPVLAPGSRTSETPEIVAQDVTELAPGTPESLSRAAPIHAVLQPLAGSPDLARGAAVQMAQIVHHAGSGTVELTLSPEELGRVRISMSSEQGTLAVTLHADRPETLDMIRRHIDMFAEELRRLGHGSVGFSFQQGSAGFGGQQPSPGTSRFSGDDPPGAADGSTLPPRTLATKPHTPGVGIDIRL
jgi:hypothetical protein